MMLSNSFLPLKTSPPTGALENNTRSKSSAKQRNNAPNRITAYQDPHASSAKKSSSLKASSIPNPIAQSKLKKVLGSLRPQYNSLHWVDSQNPHHAAKQLIQLGNHILDLQEECARWPIDKNRFTYIPSDLVIYQEESFQENEAGVYWTPPKIMRHIEPPNNTRRWWQRPWRDMADLTQNLADEEPSLCFKLHLQAAQVINRLLSWGLNPDLYELERSWKKGQTILHNTLHGVGSIDWNETERNALAQSAFRNEFNIRHNDEFSDYVEGLFHMLEQMAFGLEHVKADYPKASIKLGIASRLPDGRQQFLDLSDLFPGGSLTTVRQVTASDREWLEKLLDQSDSA